MGVREDTIRMRQGKAWEALSCDHIKKRRRGWVFKTSHAMRGDVRTHYLREPTRGSILGIAQGQPARVVQHAAGSGAIQAWRKDILSKRSAGAAKAYTVPYRRH